MLSVNEVTILGHLGSEPKITNFQNGGRVAQFSVATNRYWTDKKTGQKREKTEWHRICVYTEFSISYLEKYAEKGAPIFIKGELETRKWQDKDGRDNYTTEIVVRGFNGTVTLTERQNSTQGQNQGYQGQGQHQRQNNNDHFDQDYNYGNQNNYNRGPNNNQRRPQQGHGPNFDDQVPF